MGAHGLTSGKKCYEWAGVFVGGQVARNYINLRDTD